MVESDRDSTADIAQTRREGRRCLRRLAKVFVSAGVGQAMVLMAVFGAMELGGLADRGSVLVNDRMLVDLNREVLGLQIGELVSRGDRHEDEVRVPVDDRAVWVVQGPVYWKDTGSGEVHQRTTVGFMDTYWLGPVDEEELMLVGLPEGSRRLPQVERHLYILPMESRVLEELTSDLENVKHFSISGDGMRVVYAVGGYGGEQINVVNIEEGGSREMLWDVGSSLGGGALVWGVGFLDEDRVLAAIDNKLWLVESPGQLSLLAEVDSRSHFSGNIVVNDDGSIVAAGVYRPGGEVGSVVLVKMSVGGLHDVTEYENAGDTVGFVEMS